MIVSISNPIYATWIFISIFLSMLILTFRFKKNDGLSVGVTQELKGFAILSVIFAHIGYLLVNDNQFLFPLSILAGVGVNVFLFLSGYGLVLSHLKKEEGVLQFYKKRLFKLFVPFWIVLLVFIVLDFFILKITYSQEFIFKAVFGIFTQANAFSDLNSPLWYFTFILIYYILFPLFFSKKYPWVSAIGIFLVTYYGVLKLDFFKEVLTLYKVHIFAFPLGIFFAGMSVQQNSFIKKNIELFRKKYLQFEKFLYPIVMLILCSVIVYTAIHSGVGEKIRIEQTISLVTVCALILLFVLKKYEFRLLSMFGLYSYEIYLLHWPLMYRYDVFYKYVPAWLATILYLVLFVVLGWGLKYLSEKIFNLFSRQNSKI